MIFETIYKAVKKVVNGIGVKSLLEIVLELTAQLPAIINAVKELFDGNETVEERQAVIDSALNTFDMMTGETGQRIIGFMPSEEEEEALDHFKEMVRIILYAKFNIEN